MYQLTSLKNMVVELLGIAVSSDAVGLSVLAYIQIQTTTPRLAVLSFYDKKLSLIFSVMNESMYKYPIHIHDITLTSVLGGIVLSSMY